MSEAVIDILDDYYVRYNITGWLFPGADPTKHLSIRTAQHIFDHAIKKAKIQKDTSIHDLRHSLLICWKVGLIYVISRNFWDIHHTNY